MCGWGNFNDIWSEYLQYLGFDRFEMPFGTRCTVEQFAEDHQHGAYVLGTGKHAVAVVDGDVIDSWDSTQEIVRYYFKKVA